MGRKILKRGCLEKILVEKAMENMVKLLVR
jgi:hypothetical protein